MLVDLKTIADERGQLTVVERLPFDIKRVYWLHGIAPGAMRGGHAHKRVRRICVAISGSFTAVVGDQSLMMSWPDVGLLIEPMTWVELRHFTPGAVALFLASEEHNEADCIRDLAEFRRLRAP